MAWWTKKTTPKVESNPIYGFSEEKLPYAHSRDFMVVSILAGDTKIYGLYNKITEHTEIVFGQLSAAVINMQTAQQTLDRVKSGEANGYTDYGVQ
jgi:hypothetical protein